MRVSKQVVRVGTLVLVTLLSAGLGACGDDDDDDEAGGTTTSTAPATPQGSPAIDIEMREYAYVVSGPLTAGGTLRVSNTGEEFHVMATGKLKPDVSLDDIRTALAEMGPPGGGEEGDEDEDGTTTSTSSRDSGTATTSPNRGSSGTTTTSRASGTTTTTTSRGGTSTTLAGGEEGEGEEEEDPFAQFFEGEIGLPGNFMGPGQAADITVPELGVGRYAMVCFVPVEGGGPPHFAQGMVGEFEVVPGSAPPPIPTATYKVEPGEAIDGPETLKAGRNVLRIDAGPGAEELEPELVKPDPGKRRADMQRVFNSFETEDDFVLPEDAADQVPGDLIVGFLDFGETKTVYLGFDLTPGSYELAAPDTDLDDVPLTPDEIITIKVE